MNEALIKFLEYFVRSVMGDDDVHGYPHVERVRKIARWLSRHIGGVDSEVLEIAALLHDIGRAGSKDEGINHAEVSARIAEGLLKLIDYPEVKLRKVVNAIRAHSYSLGVRPECVEAKILSDADKLDALGAIGIARVFMYSCKTGRSLKDSIEHFRRKILRLPNLMYTDKAREEAERRVKIIREFLNELENELSLLGKQ